MLGYFRPSRISAFIKLIYPVAVCGFYVRFREQKLIVSIGLRASIINSEISIYKHTFKLFRRKHITHVCVCNWYSCIHSFKWVSIFFSSFDYVFATRLPKERGRTRKISLMKHKYLYMSLWECLKIKPITICVCVCVYLVSEVWLNCCWLDWMDSI